MGLLVQGLLVLLFDRHAASDLVASLLSQGASDHHDNVDHAVPQHVHAGGYASSPRHLLVGPHGGGGGGGGGAIHDYA